MPPERAARPSVADMDAARARRGSESGLVWEEPPPSAHGGRRNVVERLAPRLAELEDNPGRWARLDSFAGPSSANTAAGKLRKAKGKDWEFKSAREGDGSKLYGRYVGS